MGDVKIEVRNGGPLRVEGAFKIVDAAGKEFGLGGRAVVSLCRCGQSQNKPFCDGTHGKIGFKSDVQARDLPPQAPKP